MDEKKRTAFKEKCAANGRKSWAMRSAADKAAQIARINTPEAGTPGRTLEFHGF